jgi:hypothetical protein
MSGVYFIFEQTMIALTGALAIWMTQDRRLAVQKWACVVGLIGEPFWLMSTWREAQWGMFLLTLLYTLAWLRGVKRFWLRTADRG